MKLCIVLCKNCALSIILEIARKIVKNPLSKEECQVCGSTHSFLKHPREECRNSDSSTSAVQLLGEGTSEPAVY